MLARRSRRAAVRLLARAGGHPMEGRATRGDRVRDRALALIASGEDLERFAHDRLLRERRRLVLAKLEAQLKTPQRSPTRLRKPFRSTSPVGVRPISSGSPCPQAGGSCSAASQSPGTSAITTRRSRCSTGRIVGHPPIHSGLLVPRDAMSHEYGRWADLMCLVRYAGDPDPADRIRTVETRTPITRRRTLPATMVPWVGLEEALASMFGMEEPVQR